jgi:hypothetical protein
MVRTMLACAFPLKRHPAIIYVDNSLFVADAGSRGRQALTGVQHVARIAWRAFRSSEVTVRDHVDLIRTHSVA